jgi:hypothetical protein
MVRTVGRRARFFAGLTIVGLVMVPLTPSSFRPSAWFVVGLALFWAVLFAIEDLTTPTFPPSERPGDGSDAAP